ncbi:acyltransferase family protein [Nocardia sp. CA-145437]|uniref:acyltransferase family protein n=1 Tax=Nocardia sp. CA-145437 TaxID=3239980 RepID=UPI003D9554F0
MRLSTRVRREENQDAPRQTVGSEYRLDLDGLRGLAVALVVMFHIWMGRVSGGVDVFLTLSGFFFTGMLIRRAESTGSVDMVAMVRRTLARLVPAMVAVLAAVVVAAFYISPYTRWSDIATQTTASMFYYQNWQLALSWSNYLAADPSVSPLQHLWSMSVQGQYYLLAITVVAGVAWVLSRRASTARLLRPVLLTVISSVGVASFAYAAHGAATHQGWNYYDSFARLWELLAGAACVIVAPMISPPRPVRWLLAIAGVAGVLACGVVLDGADLFPGPAALLPVGATIALIASGANTDPASRPLPNRLLGTPPAVRLGELAYALYLWHWPLLIFLLVETGRPRAGFTDGVLIIGASLVLAWMTHRWIEQPLRSGTRTPALSTGYRRAAWSMIAVLGVSVIGVTSAWHFVIRTQSTSAVSAFALDPAIYPGAEALVSGASAPLAKMRPTVLEAPSELPPPTLDGCIADWNTRDVVTCTYGDTTAERTLAVVGSSHAEHWLPALQILAAENDFRIVVYLKMGCPLTVAADPVYKGQPNPDCRDWSREVIDRLGADHPDWVFTTGTRPVDDGGDETPQDYLDVWTQLSARNLNVIAVRDTPWLRRNGIRYSGIDCLSKGGDRLSCGMKRDYALNPVDPALEPAAAYPNVFPIDLTDAVCEPDICPVVEGNILIYHDEHHFTASYSRSLAPALGRELQPILGWW